MQRLWVTQRLLQQQTLSSFTDPRKTGKPRQGAVRYLFSVQWQRQMDWTQGLGTTPRPVTAKVNTGRPAFLIISALEKTKSLFPLAKKNNNNDNDNNINHECISWRAQQTFSVYVRIKQTVFMGQDGFSTYLQGCPKVFKNKRRYGHFIKASWLTLHL